jgi:hypothetical protein
MSKLKLTQEQQVAQMTEEERAIFFQNQAQDSLGNISKSYINLAEAIYHLRNELYKAFGLPTFSAYCEAVLNMKQGKAYALARVWEAAITFGLSKERLEAIGWAKADILARHVDQDNINDILEWAENETLKDFTARFRSASAASMMFTIRFNLADPHSAIMAEALEQGKKVFKNEDVAVITASIASEWLNLSGMTTEQVDAETYLRMLERSYGGKFTYTPSGESVKDIVTGQEFENLEIDDPLSDEDMKTLVAEA